MVQSFKPDTDFSVLVDSTDEMYVQIKQQLETMISASRQDLQELAKFNEFNLETIDKLDKAIDRQYIKSVIDASDVNDDGNQYLMSVSGGKSLAF
jgi:DNA-dependent RNA polymerase auxiliary subunit epsilon